MIDGKITYDVNQNYCLVLGALEYSFGRMTYVVNETQDLIKEHWSEYDDRLKERIIYFTQEFLNEYYPINKQYDHMNWDEFLKCIKNN